MLNYIICSNLIGSGCIGKVYQIRNTQPPHNLLIAKIFDSNNNYQYNNEREILTILSDPNEIHNNYIIKLKNMNIGLDFAGNNFQDNSNFIIFDYLQYGNLSKYLLGMENFTEISEEIAQLLCYKLLKALKAMHNRGVCHNKIDIKNIMFDDEFNPIIIHFTEALRINNNNFGKDFLGLGKTLAKLITSGRFMDFEYYKEKKCFVITDNFKKKYKDSKFWRILGNKISTKFIEFFDLLVKKTKKDVLNIDNLLNHDWLKKTRDNKSLEKIENDCKVYFQKRYNNMLEFKKNEKQEININSIINMPNNNNSLFDDILNPVRSIKSFDNSNNQIYNLKIKKINVEPNRFLSDYFEIIIDSNNDIEKSSNLLHDLMMELENNIKKENPKIKIDYLNDYLGLNMTEEIAINEKIDIDMDEEDEGCDINNDNIIYDEDDNEKEDLEIIIELLKYEQNEENDLYREKYYLQFNYIQGEIYYYYHYLKIIKEKAKLFLNTILKK